MSELYDYPNILRLSPNLYRFIAITTSLLISLVFAIFVGGILTFATKNVKKRSMLAISIFSLFMATPCFVGIYGVVLAVVIIFNTMPGK